MKNFVVSIFLLAVCYAGVAQNGDGLSFGAKIGVNISDITNSTGKARNGLVTGVFVDYNFSRLGIEIGLDYSQLGADKVVAQGATNNSVNHHLDYLNTNIIAKYQIFKGYRVYCGPQLSTLLTAKHKYSNATENVRKQYTPFGVGIVAGVGYTFNFGLDISATFNRGLFEILKTTTNQYNTVFNVCIGYRF